MQRLLPPLVLLAVFPLAALGQDSTAIRTTGRFSTGFQQLDNSTNSAKFTEYRDLRDNLYLFDWKLSTSKTRGMFLDLNGANVSRHDQRLDLGTGNAGRWRFDIRWNEIPHNFSNKALTPYITREPGLFGVPQTMVIPYKKLATGAADTPGVLASDTVIAKYAKQYGKHVELGTQSNTGTFGFRYDGVKKLELSAEYTLRTKTGTRLGYGPIGDRPPRTLNIELAEPVDYRTNDIKLGAGYNARAVQVHFEYLFSDFANAVDDLTWQNVYATPAPGKSFEAWDRLIGAYGRRPLAPDNRAHRATVTAGANLPLKSRLTASFSYGRTEQNQTLLPYAYQADTIAVKTLPRATADAQLTTKNLAGDYTIMPVRRVNLRAFYRRNQLENDTPSDQWTYVTQDATNLNGTVSFKNKRVSLPYAYDQQRYGIDATWRLPVLNGNLGLGYEQDGIDREYREASTSEDILRASLAIRPANWLALRAKYQHGSRDGGTYDWTVTRQSYWYTEAEAGTDKDNPKYAFDNHPDMRRYDVSDRQRDRVDVTATLTPTQKLSLSATLQWRNDDYDSDVAPIKPLAGQALADSAALTPGDQLGLLTAEQRNIALDLTYTPAERLSLNAFAGWDLGQSTQRNLEYNENNKQNPSAVATAELGPWTRATSEWTADFDDRTNYVGVGASLTFKSGASLSANYTASISKVEITYGGFGVTNFDGTPFPPNHQFAFPTNPPTVQNTSQVVDLRLDVPLVRSIGLTLGYTYDYYKVTDYQQDVSASMFESVDTDLLLRDSSRSYQWGNRLFNMGRYLAPGYNAHLGYASINYQF